MSLDITGIGSIFDFGSKLLDKFIPDPAQKAQAQLALAQLQQSGDLAKLAAETGLAQGQIDTNKVEAASTNWFIAGWRPAVGWVCCTAFAYSFVVLPFIQFLAYLLASPTTVVQLAQLPKLDLATMLPVLLGMLGLGAMRTYEKATDSESNR